MDLYTLDDNFQRDTLIDEFHSALWVERYSKSGDVELLVPPTAAMREALAENTLLALDGSDEIMLLETNLIENGVLKATGKTITEFLNNRIIRSIGSTNEDRYWNITGTPKSIMNKIVGDIVVVGGSTATASINDTHIDNAEQVISNLSLYDTYPAPPDIEIAVPFGPMYDALAQIAETYAIGFKMYLASVSAPDSYSLKFKLYEGRNLTRGQTIYPVVQFSPALDSLTNTKELRSIAGFKTICYAFAPSWTMPSTTTPTGMALYSITGDPVWGVSFTATDFKRRAMMVYADDITTDKFGNDANRLHEILHARARDALLNNNFIKMIDGEVIQQDFHYGEHYLLGDIVELDSGTGIVTNARVTEYIRSQDDTGEKAYPTVSVID